MQKKLQRKFAYGDASIGVCRLCNLCDHDVATPEEAQRMKFVPAQENVYVAPGPEWYQHAEPEKPLNPEEVLQRSIRIFENLKLPNNNVLTVGDLTKKQDRKTSAKEARQYLRNMKEGLSVGDLRSQEDDEKGLDQLFVGRPVIEPAMTESGQIDGERIRRHQEKMTETLRIRELMGGDDIKLQEYSARYLRGKAEKEPKQKA